MDDAPRRRTERKSGSSSRSPSLSRRPSLKDKKVPGTIAKVKGKKSGGGGSKKERWLLTRKTWRYMSDAVGNLLPEAHKSSTTTPPAAATPSFSSAGTSGTRRTSASGVVYEPFHPVSSTPGFHVADIPGPSGGATARPRSMPTAIPVAGTSSGPQSKASSTVTSPTYGGIMSFPSHRPGVTPTGPGPGKLFPSTQSQQQTVLISTDKFYPPSDDIPTLEKHFEAVCNKEKRFLLWTRTKPKGLSGPALRDVKQKTKEPKVGKGSSAKGGSHRNSSGSIFEGSQLKFGSGGKENVGGDYYSPTTEEEDDYDEYDEQDDITVRERRKSSTASSTMSMLGAGQCWTQGSLTFFRPLSTLSSHISESSYSMILSQLGVSKICRNTGTQTDPFPEELLIRFRLQAVQEERQQLSQRQVSPDNQSDATTVESPMSPMRLDAQKVSSPPPTTTASPMSPTTSTDGVRSSGSGRESQEKLLETTAASSTRPSISGQSESMATTKESTSTTTTTTSAPTDKKSEESGYSSSISDTVMRYLRMVRKNSKADNKDTIDKFKTVNYDRSLRYIKSKNVTVEEALEHEKNKEAQKAQKLQEAAQAQQQQAIEITKSSTTASGAKSPVTPSKSPVPQTEPDIREPVIDAKRKSSEVGVEQQAPQSPSSPTSEPSSTDVEPILTVTTASKTVVASKISVEEQGQISVPASPTRTEQPIDDLDLPPSSPPPPPPSSSPATSPKEKKSFSLVSPPSPPPQAETPCSSVGIQAGESLIRFLRNLNPNPLARKMSDFSSSCCSSDSPVDMFSPRYSFATTGMSGSDAEYGSGISQAALASMMAMAATKGTHRPLDIHSSAIGGIMPGGSGDGDASEFEDVFQGMKSSFFGKQHHLQHPQGGPLSASWTSGGSVTESSGQNIKKSSSVQQISFGGIELGGAVGGPMQQASNVPITTTSSSSSYSLSQLFHYSPSKSFRSRDRDKSGGGISPDTTSTPATPTTSSIGSSSGGLMKSFFGSSPFSSTFGLGRKSGLRKPTSTTSLTITTNTGSDSISGRGLNVPPPTTSSSPNLLSLIQSSAASAGSGFTNLFTSSSRSGPTSASRSSGGGIPTSAAHPSSATSSTGELTAREAGSSSSLVGSPYLSLSYARSSLPSTSGGSGSAGLKTFRRGVDTGAHHHYHHNVSAVPGSSIFIPSSGLSDYLLPHHDSKTGSSSTRSNVDLYLTPPGVMQKSKSSSSVLPLYGSSGSVSGAQGASSSSTAHLRVSPSGSLGAGEERGAAAPGQDAPGSSSGATATGSRLISKTKLFKSRSKSSTRATTSSSGSAVCSWSPQGRCKWKSVSGKVVTLEPTNVLNLSDVERLTLQDVALEKIRALNLGVEVKIPKEKVGGVQQKPKRRPYLLKKKALSTGFFESGSKREEAKESTGGGSGLVFGVNLSQCVTNDRLRQLKACGISDVGAESELLLSSPPSKRSQNGSRNSVSSVFDMVKDDKDTVPGPVSSLSVPAIVTACINHLENYGLHTTGIFRVSTSLKRIRQLREDLDSGKDVQFGEDHSPHDVAALLKEFLRDLPEPLLCRDLYQAFLKTQKIRNRKLQLEAVQHLVQLLPVTNRDTLAILLKFFANVVANSSETRTKTGEILPGNKMEGYSLATLIAPNILPCMPADGSNVSNASADQNAALTKERRESIDLVNYMISNFASIFEVSPELLHDVYLHLMDTNPEAIEGILRTRCGVADEYVHSGIDELETTSSVFEESEGAELVDLDEPVASTSRVYRRREDILHEGAGKGGISSTYEESRIRERRIRRDESGIVYSTTGVALSSDTEKAQSGGESDSSVGTRSSSRWFRRSRGDVKGRTSSDSGSEKVKGNRKRESSLFESKRANSLDSVNVQEVSSTTSGISPSTQTIRVSPRTSAVLTCSGVAGVHVAAGDIVTSRTFSGSDQSLRVPEHLMSTRRQSSPVLESSGIITASLKIPVPVPLNIDDSDIPYIEDENNMDGGGGSTSSLHPYQHHHHLHHLVHHHQQSHSQSLQQYQPTAQQLSQQNAILQQKFPITQFQYPHHQILTQQQMTHDMSGSIMDPAGLTVVRCRSMSTDSSVPLKTTSSSVTTTPISSPARQPSSEISSPTGFSPPTSPPLYGTFPIEEMTARMLIGSAAASSSSASTVTALSTSPSMHQFHHHGGISMTTFGSIPTSSVTSKDIPIEIKSASSTPVTKPKIEKPSSTMEPGSTSSSTSSANRSSMATTSPYTTPKVISSASQGAIASLGKPSVRTTDSGTKSATPSPQPPPISTVPSSSTLAAYLVSSVPSSSNASSHAVPPVSTQPSQLGSSAASQSGTSGIFIPAGEPKGLGKETKSANIGGLIKSKTADFDKLAPMKSASMSYLEPIPTEVTSSSVGSVAPPPTPSSQQASSGGSGSGSGSSTASSSHHHQIYSIAPKMRLRSQENVLLKQQFLLRQQQQHQQGESNTSRRERTTSRGTDQTTQSTPVVEQASVDEISSQSVSSSSEVSSTSGRSITRRRLLGSASSGCIVPSTTKPSSATTNQPASGGAPQPRVRSREPESSSTSTTVPDKPSQTHPSTGSANTSGTLQAPSPTQGSSPSRWKRSEIIASRQQSQSTPDPETFV